RVSAVTQTYAGGKLLTLLPQSALVPGGNEVGVYLVRDSGERLVPIHTPTKDSFSLESLADGGVALVNSAGESFSITGKQAGRVDVVEVGSDQWKIKGWAADIGAKEPALLIAVFVDGSFVSVVAPNTPRRDVATSYGSQSLLLSSFLATGEGAIDPDLMRVFAITRAGVAHELHRSKAAPD